MFAVIESYENLGRKYKNAFKMYHQEQIIKECFPAHILITKNGWDPAWTKLRAQRMIIEDAGFVCPNSEHEKDSLNMAINIFRRLPLDHEAKAAYLLLRANGLKTVGKLM